MCDPLILLGASVAFTGAQTLTQHIAAQEQADLQNAMYKQNAVNAQAAYLNDLALMDIRQNQEDDAYQQQVFESKRESLRAAGAAAASADNVTGVNVAELMADFERNAAEREQNLLYNRNAGALQGSFDRVGLDITRRSRINSVARANNPSVLGSLASFGGGVMPAVGQYGHYAGWWKRAGV